MNDALARRIAEAARPVAWARREGVYPFFRAAQSAIGPRVLYEGRELLMFGSNDYLGLASDPRVQEAAVHAIKRFGTGQGGAPLVCGYTVLHRELEERLASFLGREACLLFPSGYQANVGTLSALAGKGDSIICDRFCHASIIDGAVLSGARFERFSHNDAADLSEKLAATDGDHRLVVVDGVYSMQGHLAVLPEITGAARHAGAMLVVDDAHGFGVLGACGRGSAEHLGCEDSVDVLTCAMSKALATTGGFTVGDADVIEYVRHRARAGMFSAASPPANVATALAALDIIEREPERRQRVLSLAGKLRAGLRSLALTVMGEDSPIASVHVGDTPTAGRWAKKLFDRGIFAIPVVPPGVAPGMELIRLHVTAGHSEADCAQAVEAFSEFAHDVSVKSS